MRRIVVITAGIALLGLAVSSAGPAFAGPTDEQAAQEGLPMPAAPSTGHWVFVPNNPAAPTGAASPVTSGTTAPQDHATGSPQPQ